MVRLLVLVVIGFGLTFAPALAATEATLDAIVHRAQAGFLGKVESVNSRWGDASRSWIETEYVFRVEEVVVDDGQLAAGRNVTLTTWGGAIGSRRHVRAAQPELRKGGRYVLLLNENYTKGTNRSPLVGFNQGFFAVARNDEGEGEIVVDHLGQPVVSVGGTKAMRSGEIGRQKVAAEPLSPNELVALLQGDLKRIQALRLPETHVRATRGSAKSLARPLGAARRVSGSSNLAHKPPEIAAPKGFASPAAPREQRAAVGGRHAVAKSPQAARGQAKFTTTLPANLPMMINIMPKTDAFAPWGGIDENCLWLWNQYYPDLFHIYTDGRDSVAYENGVHDVHGFLDEAELFRRFGLDSWNDEPFVVMVVEEDGRTVEADIAFNAAFPFTLDDEAVYAGETTDVAFRRAAMQAFGFAIGLGNNDFPSLMTIPDQTHWDGLHFLMNDDYRGLADLYPDVPRPNGQDLTLHLFHSPGGNDWQQSTFPAEVNVGGTMTIGMYLLENAGRAEAPRPLVDWYLCKGRNWNDTFVFLGQSNYDPLAPGQYFFTTEALDVQVTVPEDTEPGEYYLGAYLRDDPEFADGVFPLNSNSAFSRTRIRVRR